MEEKKKKKEKNICNGICGPLPTSFPFHLSSSPPTHFSLSMDRNQSEAKRLAKEKARKEPSAVEDDDDEEMEEDRKRRPVVSAASAARRIRRRKRQWRQRRRGVAAVLPGGELPRRSDRGEEVPPEAQGLRGALEGALRAGRRPPAGSASNAAGSTSCRSSTRRRGAAAAAWRGTTSGAGRAPRSRRGRARPAAGRPTRAAGDHADEQPPRKPCLQAFPDQIRSMLPLFCHPPSLFSSLCIGVC
ncbi:squamosa promoter-binding protein 1 [Iris pallida]|uniref:Squamosa promoter-binding protein 1 n=1 Tax=Iris pallida TaxID=29817 RepID=A0AAX6G2A9_IRIPA|nr:squamosa promoter-binding protein 1 [Iris pallida]